MTNVKNITDTKNWELLSGNQDVKAETLMLQVQMLMTDDFNNQLRDFGDKIKFLNDIKKTYRENISNVKNFMTQNPNTSRKDGKVYYEASFEQMADLTKSFVSYQYDLENKSIQTNSMTLPDQGEKHDLGNTKIEEDALNYGFETKEDDAGKMWIDLDNDTSEFLSYQNFFKQGSQIKDPAKAKEFADKLPDDNGNLPFYFGHTNNTFSDESPKFSVFSEQLDKILEQIQNNLSDLDADTEELSNQINQLSSMRKNALEGANELVRKMAEIRNNTISKM